MRELKTFSGFLFGLTVGLVCLVILPYLIAKACWDQDAWPEDAEWEKQ